MLVSLFVRTRIMPWRRRIIAFGQGKQKSEKQIAAGAFMTEQLLCKERQTLPVHRSFLWIGINWHIELVQWAFRWRKIGYTHDNSAASENVAGAREPNVHAHLKTVREIRVISFYPWPKYKWNESATSSADGRLTRHRQGVSASLLWPWEKFGSVRLSRIKANFVDSRKLQI